ncbi:MAG TPA: hypothetical protein VFI62_09385, partial [Burkholderiales bacterium]|nr:hypothetical protein [Burkholderiales bacterium]
MSALERPHADIALRNAPAAGWQVFLVQQLVTFEMGSALHQLRFGFEPAVTFFFEVNRQLLAAGADD